MESRVTATQAGMGVRAEPACATSRRSSSGFSATHTISIPIYTQFLRGVIAA